MPTVSETVSFGLKQQEVLFSGLRQSLAAQARDDLATDQMHLQVLSQMASQEHAKEVLAVHKLDAQNRLVISKANLGLAQRQESRLTQAQSVDNVYKFNEAFRRNGDDMFASDLAVSLAKSRSLSTQISTVQKGLQTLYGKKQGEGIDPLQYAMALAEGRDVDQIMSPFSIESPEGGVVSVSGSTIGSHIEKLEGQLKDYQGKSALEETQQQEILSRKKTFVEGLQKKLTEGVTLTTSKYGYSSDETPDSNSAAGIGSHTYPRMGGPNRLIPFTSVAIPRNVREQMGIKPNTPLGAVFSDGRMIHVQAHDTVPDYENPRLDFYIPDDEAAKNFEYDGQPVRLIKLPVDGDGAPFSDEQGGDASIEDSVGPEGGGDVDEEGNAFFDAFNDFEAPRFRGPPKPPDWKPPEPDGAAYPTDRFPSKLTLGMKEQISQRILNIPGMAAAEKDDKIKALQGIPVSARSLAEEALPRVLGGDAFQYLGEQAWSTPFLNLPDKFDENIGRVAKGLRDEASKSIDALGLPPSQGNFLRQHVIAASQEAEANLMRLSQKSQVAQASPTPDAISEAAKPITMEAIQRRLQRSLGAKLPEEPKNQRAAAWLSQIDPNYEVGFKTAQPIAQPQEDLSSLLFNRNTFESQAVRGNVDSMFRETLKNLDPTGLIYDRLTPKETGIGSNSLVDMVEKRGGRWVLKPEFRDTVKSLVRQTAFDVEASGTGKGASDIGANEIEGMGILMRRVVQRNAGEFAGQSRMGLDGEDLGAMAIRDTEMPSFRTQGKEAQMILERGKPKNQLRALFGLTGPEGYEYGARPITKENFGVYAKAFAELFTGEIEAQLGRLLAPVEQ